MNVHDFNGHDAKLTDQMNFNVSLKILALQRQMIWSASFTSSGKIYASLIAVSQLFPPTTP